MRETLIYYWLLRAAAASHSNLARLFRNSAAVTYEIHPEAVRHWYEQVLGNERRRIERDLNKAKPRQK